MYDQVSRKWCRDNQEYIPKIWLGSVIDCPKDHNGIVISLSASTQSLLNWEEAREMARLAVEKGLAITWNFDFDLFSVPSDLFLSEAHYHGLRLAIEHFNNTLWNEFAQYSFMGILYQGELLLVDLEKMSHFWHTLASLFPSTLPLAVMLDVSSVSSMSTKMKLLSREHFEYLYLIVKGAPAPFAALKWDVSNIYAVDTPETIRGAVCIPPVFTGSDIQWQELGECLEMESALWRAIPEDFLVAEWHDLDWLIVHPELLTPQGLRKIKGFEAAGGQVRFLQMPVIGQ